MTCFIANPNVCRSYAKCHGWQETLVHFFIKSSRQSYHHLPPSSSSSISTDTLSQYHKDSNIDSGRESSSETNIDNSNIHIPLVSSQQTSTQILPQVFEISSSPDDPTQEKLVRQIDLSPIINENSHKNLTQTFSTPGQSLLSTSALTPMSNLIDNKDSTPEFLRRNSEEFSINTIDMITSPLQSSSTSREDLLSIVKTECSNDDLNSITSNNEISTPLPTNHMTSIKNLCDDEENKEEHRRLGPVLRQILGRIIDLL